MQTARPRSVRREIQSIRKSLKRIAGGLARLALALPTPLRDSKDPLRPVRRLKLSSARRAALKLQGQYLGNLRNLKPREKGRVKALRKAKGIRAAITFARTLTDS